MSERRGTCTGCGYRMRLRADGTVQLHWIYYGHQIRNRRPCAWTGTLPLEAMPR